MKYAIVESGGKQYKAVEGETIAVDRLPVNPGDEVKLEHVLLVADGDQFSVGTPFVNGIEALLKEEIQVKSLQEYHQK